MSEENETSVFDVLKKINDNAWEVPVGFKPGMNVPGRIFVSESLLHLLDMGTLDQVANVAILPGIQRYSMAMPDAHLGYGFPIGGVAAFDKHSGIISPGGVGFDINCGVRLIRSNLTEQDVRPKLSGLLDELFEVIPTGVGSKGRLKVSDAELDDIFVHGVQWAVDNGYGVKADIGHCESKGQMSGADPSTVSLRARKRGRPQIGTLGSGNHFLEVQYIDKIYDEEAASAMGLREGQVTFMIHCGSRGAGHQICTDHLQVLAQASKKYGIPLPDKQLACAPAQSKEAQDYFKAMVCAANYAWVNRHVIMHWTREVFERHFAADHGDLGLDLVYDVAHNIAKLEEHKINGKNTEVYVHRKGATRAFPPGHPDLPEDYLVVGQPVLIPGSMGTPSYVLCSTEDSMDISFGSACHGAGRVMSRKHAKKELIGEDIRDELSSRGILVRATQPSLIAEEAPAVYKSSSEVVDVVHDLGIARKVARLLPMGVIKG
ncbi:RtcB family protein [Methanolobus halotolerans]|uniref:tRNA-splicing ligase RtcB n=1 Tax=Methanolobus halotolerans TaxID=2052935 RepID=A0A4E0QSZ1_9EURY|nr:RtcB family protein [Methanolobus halotolerans]TGC10901.1 RNA-splicing ligase RtcB [Methanolobus halotolerans]